MKYLLGLGSNLGHAILNLRRAVQILDKDKITVEICASIYLSEAILKPDAPKAWQQVFLNTVVLIETELAPLLLLKAVKEIEREMGRPKVYKSWSPRVIDIDILTMDQGSFDHPELTIPHNGLVERHFVLAPIL